MTPSISFTVHARRLVVLAAVAGVSAAVAACGSSSPSRQPSTVAQRPSMTAPARVVSGDETGSGKNAGTTTPGTAPHRHAAAKHADQSEPSTGAENKHPSSAPTAVRVSSRKDVNAEGHHGTTAAGSAKHSTTTDTTGSQAAHKPPSNGSRPTRTAPTRPTGGTAGTTTTRIPAAGKQGGSAATKNPGKGTPDGSGTTQKTPTKTTPAKTPTKASPPTTTPATPVSTTPTITTPAPTMTTMPGLQPGQPGFSGPNPAHCLQQVGLTQVRIGAQDNTWIGNFGDSPSSDSTAIVLLTGPYADSDAATKFASSLQAIPELAAASGRWVASAAATSHLDYQVNAVAQCMGTT